MFLQFYIICILHCVFTTQSLLLLLRVCVCVVFFPSPFSPLIPHSPLQSPHCCPCPWVLFPFPSIPPPPPSPSLSCHSAVHESVFILLVSLFIRFHIWEKYLSFSDWLISLSIMFYRSIHAVVMVKLSSLQPSSILWCKCPILVLSTHLLMDTWVASKSC